MSLEHLLQENSVAYLCNLTNNLPRTAPNSIIESLYLARCCEIADKESINLPEILKSRVRCPRCFIQYTSGSLCNKIKRPRRKNKFVQKLLNKVASKKMLTSYQERYLKDNKHKGDFNSNSLVEICSFCKHKRKTHLEKPKKIRPVQVNSSAKIKKKKKKDKFVGLNKDVVLNVQTASGLKTTVEIKSDSKKSESKSSISVLPQEQELSKRAKKRKLLGLKSMLLNSKREKQSSSLQQFLTSI